MEVITSKDKKTASKKAFELLQEDIKNGAKVFGLATGSTPEDLYTELRHSDVDFSESISINLDEYVGLSPEDPQSYRYFMEEHLFKAKPFKKSYLPDGVAKDLDAECKHYDQIIAEHPIDSQILGIGRNGHIGFNEPGTDFGVTTHVVELTESTIEANKRYFDKVGDVPTHALSMGIASILKTKHIYLLAFGKEKAEAVKGMIEGPVTTHVPASVLQNHPNVTVILDEDAASLL